MNEAVKEKFEQAEPGSIISDVAAIKELCGQPVVYFPHESAAPEIERPTEEQIAQAKLNALKPLRDAERHYAEYDKLYNEVAKPILDARREALNELVALTGVGHTFQDADGIVYHVADKNGTFVEFTPYEIKRTQRVHAEGGSHIFARKTAESLGFENIFKPVKPEAVE
jgi:hypothetical protein